MKKNLTMKVKLVLIVVVLSCVVSVAVFGNTSQPERFKIDFNNAYIAVTPGSLSMQVAAEGNVLSYGEDWQIVKLRPFLYHMKQQNWQGFYWVVNTSRKELYKVTGNTFGALGGNYVTLPANISVVGGGSNSQPDRFFIYFSDSYLIFVPNSSTLQIVAQGAVLSYGTDWDKMQMKPYLYHLKKNSWQGFFWKVNTSRKELYVVRNGQFGTYEGDSQLQASSVVVYY